jgi:hypothetical protein
MAKLTTAQVRTMQAIRRTGYQPSNTTITLLRRLSAQGLIGCDGLWFLTPAGNEALDRAEGEQSCRDLAARCARILG